MPVKVIPSINRFCAIIKATIRGTVTVTIEASIVTVTVPLIVAFIIAQKRFIEGITLTGMK